MARRSAAGLLTSLDDLFTTQEERDEAKQEHLVDVPLDQISGFPDHPFKVWMDEDMADLTESIKARGVLVPALVRPMGDGYQMVAGHRRKAASELAGAETIPCIVREMSDDDANVIDNILSISSRIRHGIPVPLLFSKSNTKENHHEQQHHQHPVRRGHAAGVRLTAWLYEHPGDPTPLSQSV